MIGYDAADNIEDMIEWVKEGNLGFNTIEDARKSNNVGEPFEHIYKITVTVEEVE